MELLAAQLQTLWPGATSFAPGQCWFPLPVSMERKHIPQIKGGSYAVTEKTDGERKVLFICKDGAFLVDRTMTFSPLPLEKPPGGSLDMGTIADAELVRSKDGSRQYLLLFDCVAICGVPVHEETLWKRLGKCGTVCQHLKPSGGLTMVTKQMVDRKSMQAYAQTVARLDWLTDGFIFTPVHRPVGVGTQWDLFKLKSRLDNTLDVVVQRMPERGRYALMVREKNYRNNQPELVELGTCVMEESILTVQLDRLLSENPGVICECQWDQTKQQWAPKADSHGWPLVRTDKAHPNSALVAERTSINVQEGIEPEELF
jgi:hypothetical protein